MQQELNAARARAEQVASENDELRARVDTLAEESGRRAQEVRRLREDGATIPEEELDELRRENTRYIQEIERAKKVRIHSTHLKICRLLTLLIFIFSCWTANTRSSCSWRRITNKTPHSCRFVENGTQLKSVESV